VTPYYQDETVTLYHGDCREVTEWLSADVLVTDPPYGMAYVSNSSKHGSTEPIVGDSDPKVRDRILEAWGDRPALAFGTWRATRPAATRQLIVWDKGDSPGMGDLSMPWGPAHEEVYVLGEGFTGKRRPNLYRVPTIGAQDKRRPNHPTPKPTRRMEELISYCPPGTIADPFAGSGSTLVAAKSLGRKAIGVELEERYCEIAARRLSQGVLDLGGAS